MPTICSTCSTDVDENKSVSCDSCMLRFHSSEKCLGLAASEVRAVILKSRSLIFFCVECREAFKKIPNLVREVGELKKELRSTNKELQSVTSRVNTLEEKITNMDMTAKNQTPRSLEMDNSINFFEEMSDRANRSHNVIMFNVKELASSSVGERIDHDNQIVSSCMQKMGIKPADFKTIRVGKSRPRLLKVIFTSKQMVSDCLKHQGALKDDNIRINVDLTTLQQRTLKELQQQLNARRADGEEDLVIRFVNGTHKIIKRSSNGSRNSDSGRIPKVNSGKGG